MIKKLNLGCGKDIKEDCINLDAIKGKGVDVVWNLDKFPYPFKKNTFDEIIANMVLEHLQEPIRALKELSRICKKNGKIKVLVPHATSYANFSDLQHRNNFTEHTFSGGRLNGEYNLDLKLVKTEFRFVNKWKKLLPFKKYLKIFFLGMYDNICFEFEVLK